MKITKLFLTTVFAAFALTINAQEQDNSAIELAKMSQNPLSNMMSFPFQNNTTFNIGEDDRTSNVFNIQPVLPFFGGKLITRTILPVVSSPVGQNSSVSGVGDITFTAFYAPSKNPSFVWGVGPALVIPTNNDVSMRKWSAGPSFVILKIAKKLVYGVVMNNIWSFAGDETANDFNSMMFNPFASINFKKGWYATSGPIATANWEASSGNQWLIPVGGGGGKIVKIGKIPFNLQVQAFYNAVKPDASGDFSTRFQIQMMLPK